jgi:hypothetical protein
MRMAGAQPEQLAHPLHGLILQVQVLFQSAPGESTVTGRLSSRTPDLFEGWAGWVAADSGGACQASPCTDACGREQHGSSHAVPRCVLCCTGSTQILCLSRHVNTKLMKLVPQQSTGDQ